jgi:hypothetical protein
MASQLRVERYIRSKTATVDQIQDLLSTLDSIDQPMQQWISIVHKQTVLL